MFDPEALIVKGGVLILATLSVVRLVSTEYNRLMNDLRRKGKDR
ncbi:MAG TPA: hypothetical protein VN861_15880 [Candidatus Acidoferrales bacterium]|nr:hypothetical protein [Candidatus Acidoferrales bacterium]